MATRIATPTPRPAQGTLVNIPVGALSNHVLGWPDGNPADYTELGILAIAAVEGWKFEPPTSNNAPVLAKVRQTFQFHR